MTRSAVLVVDDDALILRVVARSMSPYFDITCVSSAKEAHVALASDITFSVIVSDMVMPGENGVQLLQNVRTHYPDIVRVMLSGAARMPDAIAAVNEGQVFRLLAKPFEVTGMRVALTAAVEQHRLLTSERELLEETLHGSIKALTDLLAIAQPMAFGRASRIRDHCTDLAARAGVSRRWDIEVAALLSQIGSVTLDNSTLTRWYHNRELTPSEQAQIARLPEIAETLIAEIPRLETVRSILRRQFEPSDAVQLPVGAAILAIARDFETLSGEGFDAEASLSTMEGRGKRYNAELLHAFREIRGNAAPAAAIHEMEMIDVADSMVFAADVHAPNGLLLIARGQRVTTTLLGRIRAQTFGLPSSTMVRMIVSPPSPPSPPPSESA
ncbi:MAG: response regulator [Gemmatimonadaceae bacterium]|nr:response regulator [Gemmatimonadaceae bacterium]